MKTRTIITSATLFLILALFAGTSFATGLPAEKQKELESIFSKEIKYPGFAKSENLNGFAIANFTVNEKGGIEIKGISATDERLKEYVETELKKITLKADKDVVGADIYYKFRFEMVLVD